MSGSIPAWAYRGAKVVCWTERFFSPGRAGVHPRVGEVCTIDKVSIFEEFACFTLVEYPGSERFLGKFFKPLITQQDDISTHFARYLNTGKDARQSDIAPVANAKSRAVPAIAGEGV